MIYKVEIEATVFVDAPDEFAAQDIAARHAMEDGSFQTFSRPVTDIKQVPPEVRKDLPWGRKDDKTIEQILSEGK